MEIKLPYGSDHLTVNIPKERLKGILTPHLHEFKSKNIQDEKVSQDEIVRVRRK